MSLFFHTLYIKPQQQLAFCFLDLVADQAFIKMRISSFYNRSVITRIDQWQCLFVISDIVSSNLSKYISSLNIVISILTLLTFQELKSVIISHIPRAVTTPNSKDNHFSHPLSQFFPLYVFKCSSVVLLFSYMFIHLKYCYYSRWSLVICISKSAFYYLLKPFLI